MLQLQIAGGRKTPSRQISGIQAREGETAKEEHTESTEVYNRKGVLP
jgi:hypothetical protein